LEKIFDINNPSKNWIKLPELISKKNQDKILNDELKNLLNEYNRAQCYMSEVMGNKTDLEDKKLKISARNKLKGKVKQVDKGIITAKVKIKIESPVEITAIISKEAVEELDIKIGDAVEAVIKATDVMVAKEK